MTIYRVKDEYADNWTNEDIYPVYVTREQIEDMARGWQDESVEDLMDQVEEVDEDDALDDVIARAADRVFCRLEAALTEDANLVEEKRIHEILHEGFSTTDTYASVYIVPLLRDFARDNGMNAATFEVSEEYVTDYFADQVRDLLDREEESRPHWYAVMMNREDTDWGYGSFDLEEAKAMARNYGPEAYIAVIDGEGDNAICVEEIELDTTEGNTVRYFLDFDSFDQDAFCLMTTDGHDTVCEGRLSEIVEPGDDWQDALDRHFEKTLGILPNEWEIG